jgi:hypothetical protein
MKWNPERMCVTNDDGTLIKRNANGCRGHSSGYGPNLYKCSRYHCSGDLAARLVKDLYGEPLRHKELI